MLSCPLVAQGNLICLFHEVTFLQLPSAITFSIILFLPSWSSLEELDSKLVSLLSVLECCQYLITGSYLSCCITFPAEGQVIKISMTRTLDLDSSISCSGSLSKVWLQVPELQHFHYKSKVLVTNEVWLSRHLIRLLAYCLK